MSTNYTDIQIDGKKVGLKFGMPSYQMFVEKIKMFPQLINTDGETMNEAGYAYIIYFGYINNCMIKDVAPNIPFEKFIDYVESIYDSEETANEVAKVFQVWADSRDVKKLVEKIETEGVKKKNGDSTSLNHSATDVSASL